MNSIYTTLIIACLINYSSYSQIIRFVKPVSQGLGDGSSWQNASSNLQMIINASLINDEVWVSGGTYKPTSNYLGNSSPTDPRTKTFVMKEGVKIYGSFVGSELNLSERTTEIINANTSFLSGDLLGNDIISGFGSNLNIVNNSENCYHIFFNYNFPNGRLQLTSSAVLNGFTITGGNANNQNSSPTNNRGGGIDNYNCSPRIEKVSFIGNSALHSGGGISNDEFSSPILEEVFFTQNNGGGGGGGIRNNNSSPILDNVHFLGNKAGIGGGIDNYYNSSPIMNNVTFKLNNASYGGGINNGYRCNPLISNNYFFQNSAFNGGGLFTSNSSPVIINASFSENMAQNVGGGIFSEGSSLSKFTNITFNSNSANSGGAIYNSGISSSSIKNCIFWKNKKNGNINTSGADIQIGSSPPSITTVSNSLLQLNNNNTNYPTVGFSFYSINVFNQDPLFFNESDVDGDDNLLGTYDDGLIPKPCSPVINKGENTGVTSLDIIGNNRISDGIVDMGAYEAQLNNSLNLVLSNPINNIDSNIGNLKAINSINATNIVDTSGKVNYLSGHIINLNAGFEVKSGAIFKATIEGCN